MKRQRPNNDPYNMSDINNALSETFLSNQLQNFQNNMQKEIINIEIKLQQNTSTLENLSKEIAKLSEVLMFFLEQKNEMKNEITNKPDYIS